MTIIWTILIGFVIGLVARALKPGKDKMGIIWTTLLGIGGSLAATYGGQQLGIYQPGETAGFIAAVIGAIILLILYGLIAGKKKGS
ncbi:MAG: GlsB/YeaQ/YmgE family stress response membrane protein [Lysobacteraceae bacterium]